MRRLAARGLVLQDVLADGDSFWNSLVIVAEDRIRARLRLAEGEPVTAMAVRRFVADHVGVEEVASISVGDPDVDLVPLIMAPGVRAHGEFARVAEAAAQMLGLPVMVITPDEEYHIGGWAGPRLHLARLGDTYRPVLAEPASARADGTENPRGENTRSDGAPLPPLSWSSPGSWSSSSESLDSGSEDGERRDTQDEESWLAAGAEVAADPAALVRHIIASPDLRAQWRELQWRELTSLGELSDNLEQPLSDPELVAQLGRLVTELSRQPQFSPDLRSAMNLVLLMSAVEPAPDVPGGSSRRYYPRVMPALSTRRLTEVVAEVAHDLAYGFDPLSRSDGMSPLSRLGYRANQPVAEQVARLSLVNLDSRTSDALVKDSLFRSLIESRLVEVALRATDGVEQAVYLQTGYAAAVNQLVRAQVPTIAGLLLIGRNLRTEIISRMPVEMLRREGGLPLPVERYLNDSASGFFEIQSGIENLLTTYRRTFDSAAAEHALRGLMPTWSRAMQTLWALSNFVPTNGFGRVTRHSHTRRHRQADRERRSRRDVSEPYGRLLQLALAAPLVRGARGRTERNDRLASAPLNQLAADGEAFWRVVWRQPGHSVQVTGGSPYGPTYVVRATTTSTQRLFLVEDPLRGAATAFSPSQLRRSLNERDVQAVLLPVRELRPLVDQDPAAEDSAEAVEVSVEPAAVHVTESARHRGLLPEDFEGTAYRLRIIDGLRRGEVLLEQFDPDVRSELARTVLGQQRQHSKKRARSESPPELLSDGSDSDGE